MFLRCYLCSVLAHRAVRIRGDMTGSVMFEANREKHTLVETARSTTNANYSQSRGRSLKAEQKLKAA